MNYLPRLPSCIACFIVANYKLNERSLMKYFAYGSNMSELRLRKRVPSATRIGRFTLDKYQLRFHKKSEDGSAKCDAYYTGNQSDIIIGALYEMDITEKEFLDKAEGLGVGYDELEVQVISDAGESIFALIYVATRVDTSLLPYSWYLNHVIVGAIENEVPVAYLNTLKSVSHKADPEASRDLIERQIYLNG